MIVEQHKTITELPREYDMSQSAIHKWCNLYGEIKNDTGEITTKTELVVRVIANARIKGKFQKNAIFHSDFRKLKR
ncbi:MAG: hypothetical protein IKG14_01875 [Clostridia bacterium]|nr:hypothetical protein [Bacilli bacterium]MBR3324783.1 hypothetical protein [Clostridia bacterium]